jgi:beta-glucosidase-like glycosyl hydrolase
MSEEEITNEDGPPKEVSGWADAMSKILGSNKPKKKKTLILSRAKKDYEVRKPVAKVAAGVEVVGDGEASAGADTEVDKEKPVEEVKVAKKKRKNVEDEGEEEISLKKRRKLELKQKKMQREWENLNRTKPDINKDRDEERQLMKIATKGVVELFNAVNLQKKSLGSKLSKAPRSEFKRDKILSETKDLFEDALEVVQKKRRFAVFALIDNC